jgi:hypothetical protein
MESVHAAEVRLSLVYQQIALLGDDGQFGATEDALTQMAADHFEERRTRDEPDRGRHFLEYETNREPSERAPRRDGFDLFGGGALAAMGRIGESLMSIFESSPRAPLSKGDEMQKERPIQQVVEQQQKQHEQELSSARRAELEAYLAQRDRERHIDRGR